MLSVQWDPIDLKGSHFVFFNWQDNLLQINVLPIIIIYLLPQQLSCGQTIKY